MAEIISMEKGISKVHRPVNEALTHQAMSEYERWQELEHARESKIQIYARLRGLIIAAALSGLLWLTAYHFAAMPLIHIFKSIHIG